MKTNDQWFQPGDKVMEVLTDEEVEAAMPLAQFGEDAPTRQGVVYCVERFKEFPWSNAVVLSGVGADRPMDERWIPAIYFRKVEEIKLCARAAKKMKEHIKP